MRIVVLPGDGIGPEITAATSGVLRAAAARFDLDVRLEEHAIGHASLKQFGATVRPELLEIVRSADGLILAPPPRPTSRTSTAARSIRRNISARVSTCSRM